MKNRLLTLDYKTLRLDYHDITLDALYYSEQSIVFI